MIEIYDANLKMYRNHRVVLWGAGKVGKAFHDFLSSLKCDVFAFCDNNEKLWGTQIDNTDVISPNKLKEVLAQSGDIVVQIAVILTDYTPLISQLEVIGVTCYIPATQLKYLKLINSRLHQENTAIKAVRDNILIDADLLDIEYALERKITFAQHIAKLPERYPILLNLPLETGLQQVYELIANTQLIYNFDSCPQGFDGRILKYCNVKKKLITAVRDPVAQNMAFIQKMLARKSLLEDSYYIKLSERIENVTPQALFDEWMREIGYKKELEIPKGCTLKTMKLSRDIQGFVPNFCKHVLDITAKPFDKQKGYSVMQGDNIEVFVYQYEKLSKVLPKMSQWLGVSVTEIEQSEKSNRVESNIKLSKKYVDMCYREPFVSHFYSDEDIVGFRKKWERQIIK